jgi:hypothetical protein
MKGKISLLLILLMPFAVVSGALYEILAGKDSPIVYVLIVVLPGAILAALRELKDFLPPSKLK